MFFLGKYCVKQCLQTMTKRDMHHPLKHTHVYCNVRRSRVDGWMGVGMGMHRDGNRARWLWHWTRVSPNNRLKTLLLFTYSRLCICTCLVPGYLFSNNLFRRIAEVLESCCVKVRVTRAWSRGRPGGYTQPRFLVKYCWHCALIFIAWCQGQAQRLIIMSSQPSVFSVHTIAEVKHTHL